MPIVSFLEANFLRTRRGIAGGGAARGRAADEVALRAVVLLYVDLTVGDAAERRGGGATEAPQQRQQQHQSLAHGGIAF